MPLPLTESLKMQAQIHAGEARCANDTIAKIYQLCTGATGEPGNWNGAEPVRKLVAENARLLAALEQIKHETSRRLLNQSHINDIAREALELSK